MEEEDEEEIELCSKEGWGEIMKMQRKKLDDMRKTQSTTQGVSEAAVIKDMKNLTSEDLRSNHLYGTKKLSFPETRRK